MGSPTYRLPLRTSRRLGVVRGPMGISSSTSFISNFPRDCIDNQPGKFPGSDISVKLLRFTGWVDKRIKVHSILCLECPRNDQIIECNLDLFLYTGNRIHLGGRIVEKRRDWNWGLRAELYETNWNPSRVRFPPCASSFEWSLCQRRAKLHPLISLPAADWFHKCYTFVVMINGLLDESGAVVGLKHRMTPWSFGWTCAVRFGSKFSTRMFWRSGIIWP